jgi:hypothetical protein
MALLSVLIMLSAVTTYTSVLPVPDLAYSQFYEKILGTK